MSESEDDEDADGAEEGAPRARGGHPEEQHAAHGLPELIAERRAKAARLREEGAELSPYAYPGVESIEAVRAAYEHLEVGEETEDSHRVAGRVAARRGAGKAAFLDLVNRGAKIQLHARVNVLGPEAFKRLVSLDLGDLLGVERVAPALAPRRADSAGRRLPDPGQGLEAAAGQARGADRRGDAPAPA